MAAFSGPPVLIIRGSRLAVAGARPVLVAHAPFCSFTFMASRIPRARAVAEGALRGHFYEPPLAGDGRPVIYGLLIPLPFKNCAAVG